MTIALWSALGVIVIGFLVIVLGGRKKKWYKVYLANNDILLMYRTWSERWWVNNKYPKFIGDNGHEYTFPAEAHWILFWERIPDGEVGVVRNELAKLREAREKE